VPPSLSPHFSLLPPPTLSPSLPASSPKTLALASLRRHRSAQPRAPTSILEALPHLQQRLRRGNRSLVSRIDAADVFFTADVGASRCQFTDVRDAARC
jgi:hypothetical protein